MTGLYVPLLPDDVDALGAALAYAAAGWYVGPAKAGTKNPGSVIGEHWQRFTSRDPQTITSWFAGTNHGVFLHAGRSGAVVLDVDRPDKLHVALRTAIDQHKPPYQSTRVAEPGRGHYIFTQPEGRTLGNRLGSLGNGWGEIRGLNGVIIVAPSRHAQPGGRYVWQRVGPVPVLPGYVATQLPDALESSDAATDEQVLAFVAQHATGTRFDLLRIHVAAFNNRAAEGESRHAAMCGHLCGAMKEAAAGYYPAADAVESLQARFLAAVAQEPTGKQGAARTGAAARDEWEGLLAYAVAQANAADPAETRQRVADKIDSLTDWAESTTGPGPSTDPTTGEVFDAPTQSVEELVFGATPLLATIRQAAHCRMVVPWAVLGAVLARVMAEVPPFVVLPPIVGSDASLNLPVALVAASGGGKSGAVGCARDVVRIRHRHAHDIGPGSGEAIIQAFLDYDQESKSNVIKAYPLALLSADEVTQIGTVQGRNSQATFGPVARTMLTGGEVSTTAVESGRCRHLPANSYRLTVVSGVQPKKSDVLLADSDAGTPQRWVWLPADDASWDAPPTDWPTPIEWELPQFGRRDPDGRVRLDVPDEAVAAIRAARIRTLRKEGDPLDGHRLLTREKVAAALALLHGETVITSQWWELSALVMMRSDQTRAECVAVLAAGSVDEHKNRGRLDEARAAGAREARAEQATRFARLIWRTVAATGKHSNAKHEPGEGCTGRCITHALRHHKGADKDAALAAAMDLAWIEQRDGRYFPGASQPAEGDA